MIDAPLDAGVQGRVIRHLGIVGLFGLDHTRLLYFHNGQEQPFLVLKMLLERPRDGVTREEIRKALWPNDTVVEFDHRINTAIKKLRLLLGVRDDRGP